MPPKRLMLMPVTLAAISCGALAAEPGPVLKITQSLLPLPSRQAGQEPLPVFIDADRISGIEERYIEAEGKVMLRRLDESLAADWMRYDQPEDTLQAKGNVVFTRARTRVEGDELRLQLTTHLGELRPMRYESRGEKGQYARGDAAVLKFEGEDRYHLSAATYTTCPVGNEDWVLRTEDLKLDYIESLGTARHVKVEYMGKPILYTPWMDFSLDDKRKSGFLTPSFGTSDKRGFEFAAPWYWNIAPNQDATFTPHYMSKRGLQLAAEYRYLERNYTGQTHVEYLANDKVAERDRYFGQIRHSHVFDSHWSGNLNIAGVSDDKYFTDLGGSVNQTSQVNLMREANLTYNGGWWSALGRLQTFQTLNTAPLYHRLPQIALNAARQQPGGYPVDVSFSGEYVRFTHSLTSYAEGDRAYAYPSVSLPFQTSYAYVTPKFGLHLSRYELERNPGGELARTRSLPIFSVDAGLQLERDFEFAGYGFIQTLEPRLYYLRIPYRNQSQLPVFDTGLRDASFYTLFSENQFAGVDRINDADQVTLALTTRFLDTLSGIERLQFTIGQRYYFSDQRVVLPGMAPRSADSSDILATVSGQLTKQLRLASGMQYNADTDETVRFNLGAFYRDGPGRVLNADYRFTRNSIDQIDLSGQWPLAPKWYGVGRVNYSFRDDRMVEALAGFEYNAGCWSLRGLLQRLALTQTETSNAFYIQLELRDLTKLGPNPLELLKRSIPGYAKSDEFNLP